MAATIGTLSSFSLTGGYGGSNHDPNGTVQTASGGSSSALNVTAAAVIKASPGRICKIVVVTAGSGGNLVINDTTTTGGAATANEILSIVGTTAAGTVITLDFPAINGIVVSAVGTGGQYSISFN